jgi:hypothetical protein
MRHQDNSFGAVVNGIFDGWYCSRNTLVVGDVLIGVERYVEINLTVPENGLVGGFRLEEWLGKFDSGLTRIKTRLSFKSTSVIESLLERDIVAKFDRKSSRKCTGVKVRFLRFQGV